MKRNYSSRNPHSFPYLGTFFCLCDQRLDSLVSVRAISHCERTFLMTTIYQISLRWHWSTQGTGHSAFPRAPSDGFEPTTIGLRVATLNRSATLPSSDQGFLNFRNNYCYLPEV